MPFFSFRSAFETGNAVNPLRILGIDSVLSLPVRILTGLSR